MILGQYDLTVNKGQITLMGSILQASNTSYPVLALSSHSLPVIRCPATDISEAEISIRKYQCGLETLGALSPLFSNIGNNNAASLGLQFREILQKPRKSTFQIVRTLQYGCKNTDILVAILFRGHFSANLCTTNHFCSRMERYSCQMLN